MATAFRVHLIGQGQWRIGPDTGSESLGLALVSRPGLRPIRDMLKHTGSLIRSSDQRMGFT